MKCKSCKNEIPDGSIFCMYCGERQIKEKKKKDEIKVPKPVQLPSGKWNIYLRAESQSVTEDSAEACILKARAIRAGFVETKKSMPKLTLEDAINNYIAANDAVLSPSTIRGYEEIGRERFKDYQNVDLATVDWQSAINEESKNYSPKTVRNAWGLVSRIMRVNGIPVPDVHLPQRTEKELAWLNYDQIQTFLKAIRGDPCEMAALMALHSLRRSELLAVTPEKVDKNGIHVQGASVFDKSYSLVEKQTNKNKSSIRTVPIMIPRLQELFDASTVEPNKPYISIPQITVYKHINAICENAGLPKIGYHGLRRSFASLAYHLGWPERQTMAIGGWSDWQTMHKIYIKLDTSDIANAAEKMKKFYKFTDEITDESSKAL